MYYGKACWLGVGWQSPNLSGCVHGVWAKRRGLSYDSVGELLEYLEGAEHK